MHEVLTFLKDAGTDIGFPYLIPFLFLLLLVIGVFSVVGFDESAKLEEGKD